MPVVVALRDRAGEVDVWVLLSVLGGEELPGVRKETAIRSSDTGLATVLLQLAGSQLGESVETKV